MISDTLIPDTSMTETNTDKDHIKATMKDAILKAAEKVFSDYGFEGASFRAISELCGAKRALILYHFKSKDALWKAVAEDVKTRFLTQFSAYYHEAELKTDLQKSRQLNVAFLKAARDVPEYGRIILHEGLTPNERIKWMSQELKPELVTMPDLQDPFLIEASLSGLIRHMQAGALLYLGSMGPLIAMDTEDADTLLSDASIEQFADYFQTITLARMDQLKQLEE
ncbi:HTH-type transcriptional regulator RutR [BD1-7 clade bacterium]|uniref:HTH-type transcriptional regulator RutR n=1 Tax=BD1-7 clade bacterium TaxID=2029982 RepID=A0A5S9QTD1_9GAMM|nr:HTH-type transcriptional regulator RutR [BD1-7 clade bacterium]